MREGEREKRRKKKDSQEGEKERESVVTPRESIREGEKRD